MAPERTFEQSDSNAQPVRPAPETEPLPPRSGVANGGWGRLLRWALPWLIFLIVAIFLTRTVERALRDDALRTFTLARLNPWWLLAAAAMYWLGSVPQGMYWHHVMRAMGQRPTVGESLRAFYIGHLGKYVPGKFMVVLLRTRLVHSARTEQTPAAVAIFVETLTSLAVAATLSAAYVAVQFRHHRWLFGAAIVAAFGMTLIVVPRVFRALVRLLKIRRLNAEIDRQLLGISWPLLVTGWVTIAASWVVMGLSMWCAIMAIADCVPLPHATIARVVMVQRVLPLLTACAALSVVAGFVSLIPGGIGAREIVVSEMLPTLLGPPGAVLTAIAVRILWLLAEVLVSAIIYPMSPRGTRRSTTTSSPSPNPIDRQSP
ncbi:MAG: flippase-like domain-containing protein [Planctomycetes bacterium]|nr:flippase-like domain-containing protein [Planctomycetota bacterium]